MEKIHIFGYFIIFLNIIICTVHGADPISMICDQTPYPDVCRSLVTTQPQYLAQESVVLEFCNKALRATLAHAQNAHAVISSMATQSLGKLAKLAWADCLELYQDTLYRLNSSMTAATHTNDDVQTRLSAAIANHQTCQNGFADFQLSQYSHALFPNNYTTLSDFSKHLKNSLAINKAAAANSNSEQWKGRRLLAGDRVFPAWVPASDRKLLESKAAATTAKANIVVAKDGSGQYKTINQAVSAAVKLSRGAKRFVIYVKRGVYKENVEIKKSMKNIMFIGDGIDATIITGSKNVQDGSTTFRSATFAVSGDGFIARGITFENTAGPQKHQAVALRSGADHSVFYSCSFKGYQDTLYVYSQRQFYRDCDIYGTVDFIFGDAVAVIQNCNIYVRKPMPNQKNTVTAQGRSDPNENTGIVVHNSRVAPSSDLRPVQRSFNTYLGRPWKQYSRTVFIKTALDGFIDPAGWLPWSGDFALKTLYYGEYMNNGAGARTSGRVKWAGYHVIRSVAEAGKFSVGNFLDGNSWLPATGLPYTSSL
nr:pectinesterase [Ipomoea batatas]